VTPPALDDDLGLTQRVEDFAIEQFITQAGIKTLDVSLPPVRAAFLNRFISPSLLM